MPAKLPSARNKIVIAGESPLVEDLAALCVDAGYEVSMYLIEDLIDSGALRRLSDDAKKAQLAIDVVVESLDTKRDLIRTLDQALPADAPLITAALSVTATQVGAWASQADWVVGFGALSPLKHGNLIELAPGLQTDPSTLGKVQKFFTGLGLETAVVEDSVGLVLPRIVCCLVNEAAYALMENVAQPHDIDTAMKLGTNYPLGPLEWGDLIGLDVVLAVLRGLYDEYGDDRYRPAPLLKQMVRAGRLGKKNDRGFYEYGEKSIRDQ
ncbi:3-hydroxybutyryl-CoA dehydrogenase [Thermoflexales bacterium]|nr:3-hydroxybutyryl-CoA dehydrogenase [Thermoflexales bacterium]